MLKFLRFRIEVFSYSIDEVRVWIYKNSAKYEILMMGSYPYPDTNFHLYEKKRFPVNNPERLSEWDAFNVNSWDDEYYWPAFDGTSWNLIYHEDGKKPRRIFGSNAYPSQWKQFIEWIDSLMPEMHFAKYIEKDIDKDGG